MCSFLVHEKFIESDSFQEAVICVHGYQEIPLEVFRIISKASY